LLEIWNGTGLAIELPNPKETLDDRREEPLGVNFDSPTSPAAFFFAAGYCWRLIFALLRYLASYRRVRFLPAVRTGRPRSQGLNTAALTRPGVRSGTLSA